MAFSLGVKRPGREADHSPPSSATEEDVILKYEISGFHGGEDSSQSFLSCDAV
jgi:hypothetical protein